MMKDRRERERETEVYSVEGGEVKSMRAEGEEEDVAVMNGLQIGMTSPAAQHEGCPYLLSRAWREPKTKQALHLSTLGRWTGIILLRAEAYSGHLARHICELCAGLGISIAALQCDGRR